MFGLQAAGGVSPVLVDFPTDSEDEDYEEQQRPTRTRKPTRRRRNRRRHRAASRQQDGDDAQERDALDEVVLFAFNELSSFSVSTSPASPSTQAPVN